MQEALKAHMPPFGSPVNPVDLTAQLTAGGTVVPALRVLAESGEVDAVVLVTSLSSAGRLERDATRSPSSSRASALPIFVFTYTRPAPSCVQILAGPGRALVHERRPRRPRPRGPGRADEVADE